MSQQQQQQPISDETTPLMQAAVVAAGLLQPDDNDGSSDSENDGFLATESFRALKPTHRKELRAADRLSVRLLAVGDDDSDEEDRILRESLNLGGGGGVGVPRIGSGGSFIHPRSSAASLKGLSAGSFGSAGALTSVEVGGVSVASAASPKPFGMSFLEEEAAREQFEAQRRICTMAAVVCVALFLLVGVTLIGVAVVGPPNQPVGPYRLLELQEGLEFFNYYTFYEGRDSLGSNGYNMYVSMQRAYDLSIVNVTYEKDILDVYTQENQNRRRNLQQNQQLQNQQQRKRTVNQQQKQTAERQKRFLEKDETTASPTFVPLNKTKDSKDDMVENQEVEEEEDIAKEEMDLAQKTSTKKDKPFIYMGSSPTPAGPRDSIRLEGNRRFNRGLFIIDVRHMPAGCGVWPAFWLTDEANWPVNGEIDIVEGVNYQSVAKTALHSTKTCTMYDIPIGTMTGTWDTAQGIPDAKTGIPDMTLRYAQDCFVYDPHQWLNQGCVAVDKREGTLGVPLNKKGGGVYALEWDPMNRHIRTWVFTPHSTVPDNLMDAIRTAGGADSEKIMPDPDVWPLPYGYYSIGDGTECPASHFRNMRLVFNTAFCGSVAGNRYFMDCPKQFKDYKTCNEYVKSQPDELDEAYWKIRGVYVYERTWERTWLK